MNRLLLVSIVLGFSTSFGVESCKEELQQKFKNGQVVLYHYHGNCARPIKLVGPVIAHHALYKTEWDPVHNEYVKQFLGIESKFTGYYYVKKDKTTVCKVHQSDLSRL